MENKNPVSQIEGNCKNKNSETKTELLNSGDTLRPWKASQMRTELKKDSFPGLTALLRHTHVPPKSISGLCVPHLGYPGVSDPYSCPTGSQEVLGAGKGGD